MQTVLAKFFVVVIHLERQLQLILVLNCVHQDYFVLVADEWKSAGHLVRGSYSLLGHLRKVLESVAFLQYAKAFGDPGAELSQVIISLDLDDNFESVCGVMFLIELV